MSLLSIFTNSVTNVAGIIKEIFYDIASKTLSTPNISVEPIDASTVGEIRLKELASNGTNYAGFKSPNALAADLIFKLPASDGSPGQVLTTDGSKGLTFSNAGSGTRDDLTSTGQTVFTASRSMDNKLVIIMQNNIPRTPGASYDYTYSGTTLTFNYTVPNGHSVTIIIIG